MTLLFIPLLASAGPFISQLQHWLHATLRRWCRQLRARATARTLMQLDSGTLRDLGLHRSEIGSLTHELHGFVQPDRQAALNALAARAH